VNVQQLLLGLITQLITNKLINLLNVLTVVTVTEKLHYVNVNLDIMEGHVNGLTVQITATSMDGVSP